VRFLTLDFLNRQPPETLMVASKMDRSSEHYASKAYANVAKEAVGPRELEARLLLKAAEKLQAVQDTWCDKPQTCRTRCSTTDGSG
jgi:hypothetical protein